MLMVWDPDDCLCDCCYDWCLYFTVKRLKNPDPVMDIEDLVLAGTKQRSVAYSYCVCETGYNTITHVR